MITKLVKKFIRKIKIAFSSTWFRLSYQTFRGKLRIDFLSIQRSSLGKNASIYGSISCYKSSIFFGNFISIAPTAEINVEGNGSIQIGNKVSIGPRTIVSSSGEIIKIGDSTSFFSDCLISGAVSIGDGCLFAKNVTVLSSTHQIYGEGTIRENDEALRIQLNKIQVQQVNIGSDCWLGMNVVIMPGVTLGKGIVVGANAVVTKSFEDYSIIAGIPAKVIGSRLSK